MPRKRKIDLAGPGQGRPRGHPRLLSSTVMRVVGLVFVALMLALATCRTYDTIYTDDAGGKCVLPSIECTTGCVDPTSDRTNCGGCGHSRKANEHSADNAHQSGRVSSSGNPLPRGGGRAAL